MPLPFWSREMLPVLPPFKYFVDGLVRSFLSGVRRKRRIMDSEQFQSASSGASATYPQQASALRKNGYVMLKNHPCKIVDMSTSKTGKHGHAKVHLVGLDLFTGKKYEDICPSTHNMNVPNVKRTDYMVMDHDDDGFLSLMDDNSEQRDDLKMPEGELGEAIIKKLEEGESILVTVLKAIEDEQVVAFKVQPK
ncbi:eukaryotic translation initiation factor 5A-2 isoform X2 [Corythoichthys intestinalis]|uniref:eukaryotic translation initiation factor 5A-2 isoform X2 n=1 Tax=Corythoichthys intestinalis TaxID=161448 RepID=UPI0025A6808A|nr:eukaryotic translation initiation factor 5A-2 isoform X2 [Corythoichthys intestinalis]